MRPRREPAIVRAREPAPAGRATGYDTDMHPFITGHLADARMSDIDRETARAALRASLRATRAGRPSRRAAVAASVRGRLAAWWPGTHERSTEAPDSGRLASPAAPPRGHGGIVARL